MVTTAGTSAATMSSKSSDNNDNMDEDHEESISIIHGDWSNNQCVLECGKLETPQAPHQQQHPGTNPYTDPRESSHDDDDDDDDDETNVRSNSHAEDEEEELLVLAEKETRAVRVLKVSVLFVLLTAAAAVSTATHIYVRQTELTTFQDHYHNYAQQIIRTVQKNAQHKLEAVQALALQLQAHAVTTNSTWPFVTLPFFEEHVAATKSLSDAYGMTVFPIVTHENRPAWEEYSIQHRDLVVNASYQAQRDMFGVDQSGLLEEELGNETAASSGLLLEESGNNDTAAVHASNFSWFDFLWGPDYVDPNNPDFSQGISSSIFSTVHVDDPDNYNPTVDTGNWTEYYPQWQTAPMSWYYQSTVNSNYGNFPDFYEQTGIVMQTHTAAFGMAWKDNITPGYLSTMLYPIYDHFHGGDKQVVAFLSMDIFWQAFLQYILPPNAAGIYVVLDNTCNQTFTFQLHGENVTFVGDGDLHERDFDSMKRATLFGQYLMEPVQIPDYIGSPLYHGFCPYTFSIYPSAAFQAEFVTNRATLYTVCVALIFVFTGVIFVTYDCLVERRQHIVLSTAQRSDAIVSSLFPTAIKDRLYQGRKEKERENKQNQQAALQDAKNSNNNNNNYRKKKNGKNILDGWTSKDRGESTTRNGDDSSPVLAAHGNDNNNNNTKYERNDKVLAIQEKQPELDKHISPLAELYPETSVLFADIVGFTAWSSSRQPSDVFLLLETIYGAFDKIAKRRRVFKVETIGDCYVAATGLPLPNPHHAIVMAKFAGNCVTALQEQLEKLSMRLGEDTLTLGMRIGIHSGPVTAGVLRGEKARFQLFGDTMNTAARMESNGLRNRIHLSKETADLIVAAGKGHWIIPRENKIIAKGKGEMQTYWLERMYRTTASQGRTGSGGEMSQSQFDLDFSETDNTDWRQHYAYGGSSRHDDDEDIIHEGSEDEDIDRL